MVTQSASEHKKKVVKKRPFKNQGTCDGAFTIGRGVESSYMQDVCNAKRKHLLVKKSDAETNFYYMGLFDVIDVRADKKKDNNGKERDIAKVKMQMRHSVRDDLLRYLQSSIGVKGEKVR